MESTEHDDRDCVLNALFFILQNKKSLNVLATDANFIINWLRTSNYLNEDLRKSFFMSLKSLLYLPEEAEDIEDYNATIYRIFSNVKSPENYAEGNGDIRDAVAYIIKYVLLPVETTETKVSHFTLLHELIQWHWGFKELFRNSDFLKYLLNRKKNEPKTLLEAKYEFVTKTVSNPLIDEKFG
jgi:hypothetical protein